MLFRSIETSTLAQVSAYLYKQNGHNMYVLTLHDIDITLVFDIDEKAWYQWTQWTMLGSDQGPNSGTWAETYFKATFYAEVSGGAYVLDDDYAYLYKLSPTTYLDNSQPIYYRIITQQYDSGTTHRKFFGRMEIIGDKVSGGTMSISHTGNDYNTWSTARNVDLNASRSQLYLGGSDRRRAWSFVSSSNVPLRLRYAEVDFRLGEKSEDRG